MQKLIIALSIALLAIVNVNTTSAQVSGHRGGWLLVKSDLVTPLMDWGANVQLEFVAFRKMSFTIDYNYQNKNVRGNYAHMFKYRDVVYANNLRSSTDRSMAHGIMLGIRRYMNRALPAPNGFYMYAKGGAAGIFSKGEFSIAERSSGGNIGEIKKYKYSYGPMLGIKFEYGYGYQFIFFKRMVLDVSVGVNIAFISGAGYTDVDVDGENVTFDNEGAAFPYAGNVLNWGFGMGNLNGTSNLVFAQGFNIHLSLGVLAP